MTPSAGPPQPASSSAGAPAPPQPGSPQPPPISAPRAYAEVLIVFALFFAVPIINAAETLGGGQSAPTGGWGSFAPATVDEVTQAAVACIAVVLLAARRGITRRMYGICLPAGRDGRGSVQRALWMAAIALVALVVGAVVTNAAAGGHHLPQPSAPSVPYVVYSVAGSLFSGVVEEMVALAFVVSTLRQARRPAIEIVIVAVLLRCSYHIYYGAGIAGIAVWAAVFAILYLWLRSVIPLIILHFLWDAVQFMGLKWPVVGGLGELAGLLLLLAGLGCGLADLAARNGAKRAAGMYGHQPYPPGVPYPPGAYPQPPSGPAAPYTAYPPPPGWLPSGPGPFGTYPPVPGPGHPPPPGAPYPSQPSPYSQQPPPGYTQAPPGYTQTPPPGYGPPPGTAPPSPGYVPPPGTAPPPPGGTPPGSDTSAGGTPPEGAPPSGA